MVRVVEARVISLPSMGCISPSSGSIWHAQPTLATEMGAFQEHGCQGYLPSRYGLEHCRVRLHRLEASAMAYHRYWKDKPVALSIVQARLVGLAHFSIWTFVAFHGTLGLVGFMLRQFEIARSIRLRPYNALAFSAPIAVFVSVFLVYPLGSSSKGSTTGRSIHST